MRCSFIRIQKKSSHAETEDTTNYRILQDLEEHNWLLKKLKWLINSDTKVIKSCEKFIKADSQKSKMSGYIKLAEREYQIIDETEEIEFEDTSSTAPVSLDLLKKLTDSTFNGESAKSATGGIATHLTQSAMDVMSKELNKTILRSALNSPSGLNKMYSELVNKSNYKQKNDQNNQYNVQYVRNVQFSANNGINKTPRTDSMVSDNHKFIKHKLPVSTPPQREKYNIYENNALVVRTAMNGSNNFIRKANQRVVEIQTEDVIIIDEAEREYIDFLRSHDITVEQLKTIIRYTRRKDAETNTDLKLAEMELKPMRGKCMHLVEAVSYYNKEWFLVQQKRSRCTDAPEIEIELIKLSYLRKAFETLFGTIFAELVKNYNEELTFNNLPDVVPKKIVRKRRVSVPALNNTEDQVAENIPSPKKSRAQKQMLSQATYPPMPHMSPTPQVAQMQRTQYPRAHDMGPAENPNYVNRNIPVGNIADPRNYVMNQQYQGPRTQPPQMEMPTENPLPFYNTGPRMVQPYAMQFTREQHTEYVTNAWQYPEMPQNLRTPYINGDPMAARAMPPPEQRNYHNQVQRNGENNMIPNYPNWNMNMRHNGHM